MTAELEPAFETGLVLFECEAGDPDFLKTERWSERLNLQRECRKSFSVEFGHCASWVAGLTSIISPMNEHVAELPIAVYSAEQVREMDRIAIEEHGVSGYELMCRAGQSALDVVRSRWPDAGRLMIYCGAGNNAGDGYVLARLARAAGLTVIVRSLTDPDKLAGDAATAWTDCRDAGIDAGLWDDSRDIPIESDLIVDALLGTGLDRDLGGPYARAVQEINAARPPVLALDIPTGLHADTGLVLGSAVEASATITFVGLKTGLFLGLAPDYCGDLEFAGLGIPAVVAEAMEPVLQRLAPADIARVLTARKRTAHKGDNGRLLLIGGGPNMAGAIRLAAEAALRTGAGLVHVATHPDNIATVMSGRPEIICRGVDDSGDLADWLAEADAVVLGPGLGRGAWASKVWAGGVECGSPLVVDADGLNLLAESGFARSGWILTPHPGEAARLLGSSAQAVNRDRLGAVRALGDRFAAAVVLKGANTLVRTEGAQAAVYVCDAGNPGMATAGMGDVLSGVLGGLLAQTRDIEQSVKAGVELHAVAGDAAALDGGERGLLASDLLPYLRKWANPSL